MGNRPITDSLTWHAYGQIAAALDAASKGRVRDMTNKSKLKFVRDNSVPAIADAIDNAIQRAIDLQHLTPFPSGAEARKRLDWLTLNVLATPGWASPFRYHFSG
jgi:hypothetical protein